MSDQLLTFHCAAADREVVAQTLRDITHKPVHVRAEDVLGRDFDDASTGERVRGKLHFCAVEVVIAETEIQAAVAAIAGARRTRPVRWHAVAVSICGRLL